MDNRRADASRAGDAGAEAVPGADEPVLGRGPLIVAAIAAVVILGIFYGFLRAAVAVLICATILYLGFSYFRNAGDYPPEPEPTDVAEYGLKYVCTMCGLELKVEVAARDKAPSHCMEPMVLVRSGGEPHLRPID